MSQLNPSTPEPGQEATSVVGKGTNESAPAKEPVQGNSAAGSNPSPNGTPGETEQRPAMKRAEALADRLALQVGVVSTVITEGLKRFVARAREEAEDLWAEAQHIRKGTKS
jgi:hypothetical protein